MNNEIQVILKPYSRPLAAGLENKRGVQVRVEVKSSAEKSQREIFTQEMRSLNEKCRVRGSLLRHVGRFGSRHEPYQRGQR